MPARTPPPKGHRNFDKGTEGADVSDERQVLPSQLINCAELMEVLDDLVEQGGNMTIGRVKTGGAVTIRLYLGFARKPVYLVHSGDWGDWLNRLVND